jgi:hypothetical protein
MTIQELKSHFHKGQASAYAWPGGYPPNSHFGAHMTSQHATTIESKGVSP